MPVKTTQNSALLNDVLAKHSRDRLPVLYLSGPMTGLPNFNFGAFNEAARRLRHLGFPVLNPADFGPEESNGYSKTLARDLLLLPHAAILVVLDGFERSHGAGVEIDVAIGLKIPIVRSRDMHAKVLSRLFDLNELFALDMLDRDRQDLRVGYTDAGEAFVGDRASLSRLDRLSRAMVAVLARNFDVPAPDEDDDEDDDEDRYENE